MNREEIIKLALQNTGSDGSVDVIHLSSIVGIDVFGANEKEDFNAEITHVPNTSKFEILVNINHPLNRQRFSIAHELAHYVLHKDRIEQFGSLRRAYNNAIPGFDEKIEKEADELAAEILIPEKLLNDSISKVHEKKLLTMEEIQRIAHKFKVSFPVAIIRLRQMGHQLPYISFSYSS